MSVLLNDQKKPEQKRHCSESALTGFTSWLETYGAKRSLLPTLFDFKELLDINAKRCTGFNIIFSWMYVVFLPIMTIWTVCGLIEATVRWKQGNPVRNSNEALRLD